MNAAKTMEVTRLPAARYYFFLWWLLEFLDFSSVIP